MDMYTKNHFGTPKRNFVISKGMFDLDKTTKLKNHENQKIWRTDSKFLQTKFSNHELHQIIMQPK